MKSLHIGRLYYLWSRLFLLTLNITDSFPCHMIITWCAYEGNRFLCFYEIYLESSVDVVDNWLREAAVHVLYDVVVACLIISAQLVENLKYATNKAGCSWFPSIFYSVLQTFFTSITSCVIFKRYCSPRPAFTISSRKVCRSRISFRTTSRDDREILS